MRSKRRQEGYLLIDHRASPGTQSVGENRMLESATITCSHCQSIVVLNPERTRSRGYCPKCDHYVCDNCEAIRVVSGGECVTYKQRLDIAQERIARGLPPEDNNE